MVKKSLYWSNPEKYRAIAKERLQQRMEFEPEKVREEKRLWVAQKRATEEGAIKSRAAVKKHRDANKAACQARTKAWGRADPRRWMILNAKTRAKKLGLPFDIVLADLEVPTRCPVLGIEITMGDGTKGFRETSPSLDKIIPSLGYVKGNVKVISVLANTLKRNEITPDRLRAVADYIEVEVARINRERGC